MVLVRPVGRLVVVPVVVLVRPVVPLILLVIRPVACLINLVVTPFLGSRSPGVLFIFSVPLVVPLVVRLVVPLVVSLVVSLVVPPVVFFIFSGTLIVPLIVTPVVPPVVPLTVPTVVFLSLSISAPSTALLVLPHLFPPLLEILTHLFICTRLFSISLACSLRTSLQLIKHLDVALTDA